MDKSGNSIFLEKKNTRKNNILKTLFSLDYIMVLPIIKMRYNRIDMTFKNIKIKEIPCFMLSIWARKQNISSYIFYRFQIFQNL